MIERDRHGERDRNFSSRNEKLDNGDLEKLLGDMLGKIDRKGCNMNRFGSVVGSLQWKMKLSSLDGEPVFFAFADQLYRRPGLVMALSSSHGIISGCCCHFPDSG